MGVNVPFNVEVWLKQTPVMQGRDASVTAKGIALLLTSRNEHIVFEAVTSYSCLRMGSNLLRCPKYSSYSRISRSQSGGGK